MVSCGKLYRHSVVCFSLLFLLSGTASAVTSTPLDAPAGLPRLKTPEKIGNTYPSLAQFEEKLETVESGMPDRPDQSPAHGAVPPVSTYVKDFFPDVVGGTKRIFSLDNLPLALIGATLTGLAVKVDHTDRNVKNYFQTRRPMDGPAKYGDMIGQTYYHVGLGAALFGIGELSNDKRLADTGIVTLEALLVNGIVTEGMKYTFGRTRPNGGNHMSFPSGHASSTATVAASISAMYDWDLKIAVPLYATAFFVGASRIQENEHYLSDVLAGLTIGTIIGSSFARYHKEKDNEQKIWKNISFSPLLDKDLKGGLFTMKW